MTEAIKAFQTRTIRAIFMRRFTSLGRL